MNGLPLVVIELKKLGVPVRAALEWLNPALPRLPSGQVALRSQAGLC